MNDFILDVLAVLFLSCIAIFVVLPLLGALFPNELDYDGYFIAMKRGLLAMKRGLLLVCRFFLIMASFALLIFVTSWSVIRLIP